MKALLIIDVQKGLDSPYWGERNNPGAEANMKKLLFKWRNKGWPIIHVKHNSTNPKSPLKPGLPGNKIKDEVLPLTGEPLFQKNVNSAFIGTNLEDYLIEHNYQEIVMIGLTTNHCISSSARMSANLGFSTTVVADATAAHEAKDLNGERIPAEVVHQVSIASLNGEFAEVLTTAELLQIVNSSD